LLQVGKQSVVDGEQLIEGDLQLLMTGLQCLMLTLQGDVLRRAFLIPTYEAVKP
jgi:hypothetical protein